MKLLENCTDIKHLNSIMWAGVLTSDLELDLSELSSLTDVNIGGWNFKVNYPSSLVNYTADQALPPVFSVGSSLNRVYIAAAEPGYLKGFSGREWVDFFESLENCENVVQLNLYRCNCISDDSFYKLNGKDDRVEIFSGSKVGKCYIKVTNSGMGYVLQHLRNLKSLSVGISTILDSSCTGLNLDNLTYLSINGNYFENFSIFGNLSSLATLEINNCENFKTLSGLKNLTSSLTKLVVNNTGVSSVVPLKDMVSLIHLDLKNNAIGPSSDDSGKSVSNLDILASLHPNGTREDNLKGNLKTLYLQGNDGLNGFIDSHPILNLEWSNGNIWK